MRAAAHLCDTKEGAEDCDCYQGNFCCSGFPFSKRKIDRKKRVGSAGKAAWPALAVAGEEKQVAGRSRERLCAAEINGVPWAGHAGEGSDRAVGDEAERDGEYGPEGYGSGIAEFLGF